MPAAGREFPGLTEWGGRTLVARAMKVQRSRRSTDCPNATRCLRIPLRLHQPPLARHRRRDELLGYDREGIRPTPDLSDKLNCRNAKSAAAGERQVAGMR